MISALSSLYIVPEFLGCIPESPEHVVRKNDHIDTLCTKSKSNESIKAVTQAVLFVQTLDHASISTLQAMQIYADTYLILQEAIQYQE